MVEIREGTSAYMADNGCKPLPPLLIIMVDFSFITERLATGAAINDANDVGTLVSAGITHIINCRTDFDDSGLFAYHPQIIYLWDGTDDDGQHPKPAEWFNRGIVFALQALVMPKTKVYAHCAAGVNRGPSLAYAVLRSLGLSASASEGMIRSARPQVGLAYKEDAELALKQLGYI